MGASRRIWTDVDGREWEVVAEAFRPAVEQAREGRAGGGEQTVLVFTSGSEAHRVPVPGEVAGRLRRLPEGELQKLLDAAR